MISKNDLDKQLARSLPPLGSNELKEVCKDIIFYLDNKQPFRYLMLLSNELHYYTIFDTEEMITNIGVANKIINFLTKDSYLTREIGSLKLVEITEDYIEIWINDIHFALFPCDSFIVVM